MAQSVVLTITGDPKTGVIALEGPINNPVVIHWLLGEAERLVAKHLNEKQAQAGERRIHIPDLHIGP